MKAGFFILIVLLVAGGVAYYEYPRWKTPAPLVLSGTIEARDVQVGSLVGGRVLAVYVDEGTQVTSGQTLVTLEPDLLDLQIREQQTQIETARAQLAKTIAGPRPEEKSQARADWVNAETERKRLEKLLKTGVIPQEQYDNAATTAKLKLEALKAADKGGRPEDIDAARATVAQGEAHLAYLQRQLKEMMVASPARGVVQTFDLRPGDLVAPSQPVLDLLETDQIWVRVYVPEPKLGLIHVGQTADITVDTFPNRVFTGRIAEIRQQGEYTPRNIQTLDQRTDLVFGVKVDIAPNQALKPGMAAFVTLK